MSVLDIAVIGVVALSLVLAWARGVIRSLIGTLAWIVGFVAAIAFAPAVAVFLPETPHAPWTRYLVAFVGIFIAAIVVGALIAWPLRAMVKKAGLGFVDASLGAMFGLVRGIAAVVAFALIAGTTGLAQRDWWQNAFLAPSLAAAVLALRPWLPQDWAERLNFSPEGAAPAAPAAPKKV